MPNNAESNLTLKIAKAFTKKFENTRVLSKSVNTQLLDGKFDPNSGTTTYFKRPHDYRAVETSDGDISGETKNDIISGRASGTVQNMITTYVDFSVVDQALKLGGLDEILAPMATRIVTKLELNFAAFMLKNAGLLAGTHGQAVDAWTDVAQAGAVMTSHGVPMDAPWYYGVNPYTQAALASVQRVLGAVDDLVSMSHRKAMIARDFAGMDVMTATTLPSFTTNAITDRAGTLSASPDVTYLTAKDTMMQSLAVTAFTASLVVKAGEIIQIAGRNRLNLSTREPIVTGAGANVLWTGVVTADVTLDGSGAGTLVCSGPAIFEALGQYNTVESAPVSGDVVTLLGAASTLYQPNIFWHRDAFSIGSVPIPKLFSTDTLAETEDGLQLRVSKFSDGLTNKQKVRIDLHPAFAALNPFFAGQGYGLA